MKYHMIGWKVVSIVLGVLALLGAAGYFLLQKYSAMLDMVLAGLALFATASVCAWMDDLMHQLAEGQELQKRQIKGLSMIIEELRSSRGRDEKTEEKSGTTGRRRATREEEPEEPEPTQEGPAQFNAKHIADVYRMAQRIDQ